MKASSPRSFEALVQISVSGGMFLRQWESIFFLGGGGVLHPLQVINPN